MLNDTQVARLAAMATGLRPDWPQSSLYTFINRELRGMAYRDVAVMLAWVACDERTATPKRILEAGPWRKAAVPDGAPRPIQADRSGTCGTCYERQDVCRTRWAGDHEFLPLSQISRRSVPARERKINQTEGEPMSTVDHDREEARDAERFDRTTYRRIGGQLHDADLVPDKADVAELGE